MTELKSHHPGPWNVGQVSWNDDGDVTYTLRGIKEARHADMLLIDAAPDLLDALKGAVATWEKFYHRLPVDTDVEDAEFNEMNVARSAICKALGSQPWDYHQIVKSEDAA